MKLEIFLILFVFLNSCSEQKPPAIQSFADYYFSESDSASEAFIFLTGYNQNFQEVLKENQTLVNKLKQEKYSVLFINSSRFFMYDSVEVENIYKKIIGIFENKLPARINIGGFSLGGFGASKLLLKFNKEHQACKSLILIDSPLDLGRFAKSIHNQMRNNEKISREEAIYIYNLMQSKADSSLISIDSLCRKETVMLSDNTMSDKESSYLNIPIFAFTNVSLEWQFSNRERSLYDMHALDLSMFLSKQKKNGNRNVFLYVEKTEKNNPHSWSNLNIDSLLKWVSHVR